MNWLKNAWYVAGFAGELTDSNVLARTFLGTPVVMMRSASGELSALDDACPHRLFPLSSGRRVGDALVCGYHGLKFTLQGVCIEAPGQSRVPAAACVRRYPLAGRHGLLWIWLGKPAAADLACIPDIVWNDDPRWAASRGYHRLQADFRLSVDNLMDLGHETWVHAGTIGNDEEQSIASYAASVTIEADCLVRAHREMPNIDAPPFFRLLLNHEGQINRWQTAISVAPSICMTDVGVYPVAASLQDAWRSHVLHLLTPESEYSTHYFWSFVRNQRLDDEALTASIQQALAKTFDEDAVVLALQQRQLDRLGGTLPRVALKVDDAPLRSRRLLAALVKREADDPDFVFRPPRLIGDGLPVLAMR